jgi:Ca2+-binding RTX toxin-like protein
MVVKSTGYDINGNVQIGANAGAIALPETIHIAVDLPHIPQSTSEADLLPMFGTTGSDDMIGTSQEDLLIAFGGADTLSGGKGADAMFLGAGTKTIRYGEGDSGIFSPSGEELAISAVSTTGFDLIYGLGLKELSNNAADRDRMLLPGNLKYENAASGGTTSVDSFPAGIIPLNQYLLIRGDFDPSVESFKASALGKSSLLAINLNSQVEGIVLVGFSGLIDSSVLGQLSLVPPGG